MDTAKGQWILSETLGIPILKKTEKEVLSDELKTQTIFSFNLDRVKGQYCTLAAMTFYSQAEKLNFHEANAYRAEHCIVA